MTTHKQVRVDITLPIDPPHPFIAANDWHPEVLATRVSWVRTITERWNHTRVVVFAEDGLSHSYYPPFDKAPGWVPRPPDSWHAAVSELAADVLKRDSGNDLTP